MNQNDSLLDVFVLLYKWRKQLIGVSFLAALLTAGVSLMLPNYYEAHTLFYAASPDLAKPTPVGHSGEKTYIYGSANDLDRIFSLAKSSEVITHLTESFDLYKHYDIDPEGAKAKYKLLLKLDKRYKTKKTKYDAIDLSFEDTDPELAARICNAAREKIDELAQGIIKSSQKKLIDSHNHAIAEKERKYTEYSDSLATLRTTYGIFSTDSQGEAYGSSLVEAEGSYLKFSSMLAALKGTSVPQDSISKIRAKVKGYESQVNKLRKDISAFGKGYPKVKNLERTIKDFAAMMNLDKQRLLQLDAKYKSIISAIHLVERAEVPVRKSRPKRSIYVMGIAFMTFVLMALWLIIKQQFDSRNWREAFAEA